MAKAKGKKAITYLMPDDLFERMEKWRAQQPFRVGKIAFLDAAVCQYLDDHPISKKKKPAE